MKRWKKIIIKMLGGHTDSEYRRLENKYDSLLQIRSDNEAAVAMTNEYVFRVLSDLDTYMKSLWEHPTDVWAFNAYKIVHNNMMYVMTHLHQGKLRSPYRLRKDAFYSVELLNQDKSVLSQDE